MAKRAKIQNRERLLKKMAALPTEVRSAIRQALAESADEITDMQKRFVSVKSGKLRNSIVQNWGVSAPSYSSLKTGNVAGDPDLTVTISAGNSGVRYAHLVEFGTAPHINGGLFKGTQNPGTKARPFFYGPYRAQKKKAKARVARATRAAARRVAAGGGA